MITHKISVSARVIALALGAASIAGGNAQAQQVFPSNVIIQGSLCVGFDCVAGESFGFDTIRLKENNLRIKFEDTSVGAFPTNDWQILVNDSASGGLSRFSIEDVTGSRIPFTIEAGATTNSVYVDSTGRVGFRTSTPVLDLHVNTSNTPAIRLEQNNTGGFTAQTWDMGGNEANFFIRDVTGGSLLPFRIRPGAKSSSLDISSSGKIGIGTGAPVEVIHSKITSGDSVWRMDTNTKAAGVIKLFEASGDVTLQTNGAANVIYMRNDGNVGLGTTNPAVKLHTTGGVRFAGVAGCGGGIMSDGSGNLSCIASSRTVKNLTGELPAGVALANIMALRPQTGSYKATPDVPEHWLVAEEVAAVDPALAGIHEGQPNVVKTQNIVADLVAVVQQQQREIEALKRRLSAK